MADNHDSDARNGDPGVPGSGQAPAGRNSSWTLGMGIALGAAVGIILGSIFDNVGLGLALGILIGIIVVVTVSEWRRRMGSGSRPHD
jgi:uncharacterized membrane protein YfcA